MKLYALQSYKKCKTCKTRCQAVRDINLIQNGILKNYHSYILNYQKMFQKGIDKKLFGDLKYYKINPG